MNKKRVLKPAAILIMVVLSFCMLCYMFMVGTPEKAVKWELYYSGEATFQEAMQAQVECVNEGKKKIWETENMYVSTLGNGEKKWWMVSSLGKTTWIVTEYTKELQDKEILDNTSRQEMVEFCIQHESSVESSEGKQAVLKKYAVLSDKEVQELYKQYFLGDSERGIEKW